MLCSRIHCQKGFDRFLFSYKIRALLVQAVMEVGTSATIQIYRAAATAPANPAERGEGLEDIVVERAHELEGSDEEVRERVQGLG